MSKVCGFERDDGAGCEASFGLCESCGYCWNHCPHREEERREARRRGGIAKANKYGSVPLADEDLPPLETHEDAKLWLDVVGRAVVTGRLGDREAQAAIRAVSEWVKTEAENLGADMIHELRERVEALEGDVKGSVRGIS